MRFAQLPFSEVQNAAELEQGEGGDAFGMLMINGLDA
jgi:hypothetical protein